MGLILFVAVVIYGYYVKNHGNSLKKTILNCIYLFLVARLFGLFFQITPAVILGTVPENILIFTAMIIPSILYIIIPIFAYRKAWFGIRKK